MTTRPINSTTSPSASVGSARTKETESTGEAKRTGKAGAAAKGGETKGAQTDWDVSLSTQSRDKADAYKKALDIARGTPDVREDKIAELKKKIQDGTYEVDSAKVADGMMLEAIKERLAEPETAGSR